MSALIKSGAVANLRSLHAESAPLAELVAPIAADPRDIEIARLSTAFEQLEIALAEARDAQADVREQGRRQGLSEAGRQERERVAAVEKAVSEANATFAKRLDMLDGLAAELVRTALAKLFGSVEDWSPMIVAAVGRQVEAMRRSAVVAIRLSAADFSAPDVFAASDIPVTLDRSLKAGNARIDCTLGQVDIVVADQWRALAALLDELAGEAAAG